VVENLISSGIEDHIFRVNKFKRTFSWGRFNSR